MITFAKGVTSGYLPLGGVVVVGRGRRAVLRGARRPDAPPRRDLRRPPDVLRGRAGGDRHLRARGPHPARPRARGAAARRAGAARRPSGRRRGPRRASACSPRSSSRRRCSQRDPARSPSSRRRAREAGVLVRPLLGAVAVSPPLIVEQEHIDADRRRLPGGARRSSAGRRGQPVRRLAGTGLIPGLAPAAVPVDIHSSHGPHGPRHGVRRPPDRGARRARRDGRRLPGAPARARPRRRAEGHRARSCSRTPRCARASCARRAPPRRSSTRT